ncbi:porin family protein [Vibrio ostreicida]|uniref:Porin family protein n=1 Tax=Vibrio ostreicida TaxID=526588 RepID=A0ABT8BUN5_9VIBR|nr:porin family protein [Vibrio ostreicida]MDN3610860.1 porin family protein [Vibrio ostreicida]NPD10954.1 porin family protein [Vibrio ostreicida]
MKMKYLAALIAVASTQAVGAENLDTQRGYLENGWYVGADIISTDLDGTLFGPSLEEVSSTNVAFSVGYSFQVAESFVVGVEGEYLNYGEFDLAYSAVQSKKVANTDISAFSLNLKPKYFVADSGFYVGGTLGLGTYHAEMTTVTNVSDSASDTGFTYGVEAGYALNNSWLLSAGYRVSSADIDGFDIDMNTLYAGIDYKF